MSYDNSEYQHQEGGSHVANESGQPSNHHQDAFNYKQSKDEGAAAMTGALSKLSRGATGRPINSNDLKSLDDRKPRHPGVQYDDNGNPVPLRSGKLDQLKTSGPNSYHFTSGSNGDYPCCCIVQ